MVIVATAYRYPPERSVLILFSTNEVCLKEKFDCGEIPVIELKKQPIRASHSEVMRRRHSKCRSKLNVVRPLPLTWVFNRVFEILNDVAIIS
jgi:hypothetical protein